MDKRLKYITQQKICDGEREGYLLHIEVNEKCGPYMVTSIKLDVGMEEVYEYGYLKVAYDIEGSAPWHWPERYSDEQREAVDYFNEAGSDEGGFLRLSEILKECGFTKEAVGCLILCESGAQDPGCTVYDADELAEEINSLMRGVAKAA